MPLICCKINLFLTWSSNCVVVSTPVASQVAAFTITDTKLSILIVILSTQDNANCFNNYNQVVKKQLAGININQYQECVTTRNPCLSYLIDPSFQGVSMVFVLLFENNANRTSCNRYFLSTV